jgi:methylphosphotriester-DNA--protein-cysteine methyltransferase
MTLTFADTTLKATQSDFGVPKRERERHTTTSHDSTMPSQPPMVRAMEYVIKNWHNGDKQKEIAYRFRVDAGNFAREFRNAHGITIKRFVDEQRKKRVQQLLKDRSLLGYQIAKLMNMNEQTFYRWIKRMFGASLLEVRGRMRQRKE